MIDRFWRRFVAAVAMVACCGASIAIALGVVVVSSTVLIGGIAAVAGLGCVVAMSALGHGRARATHASKPDTDASSVSA